MPSDDERRPSGPEPERLRLDADDWEDAVARSLKKGRPDGEWQKHLVKRLEQVDSRCRCRPDRADPMDERGDAWEAVWEFPGGSVTLWVTKGLLNDLKGIPRQ